MKVQYLWCQTLSNVSVCRLGYPSTPIPPLGLSPCRPLGTTIGVCPEGRKLLPMGHGMSSLRACYRAYCNEKWVLLWQMVTQQDQILEWLCGLCRPTGKADGKHGGCKGWTWLYRALEWALCPVALGLGCPW